MSQIWKAKYALDSSIHPDTNQLIPLPFRMSAFVPVNLLLTAGMLSTATTTTANSNSSSAVSGNASSISSNSSKLNNSISNSTSSTITTSNSIRSNRNIWWQMAGWHWLNQSINTGVNYSNANKSTPVSTKETAVAYLAAVGSSVGVAIGLSKFVESSNSNSTKTKNGFSRVLVGRMVPFVAVAVAGVLNVMLMRQNEIVKGVDVYPHFPSISDINNSNSSSSSSSSFTNSSSSDLNSNSLTSSTHSCGKSTVAGWEAVKQVSISRVCTALPVLTLPPLIVPLITKKIFASFPRHLTASNRAGKIVSLVVNLTVIGGVLMSALPVAVAFFPQTGRLDVDEVEERFRALRDGEGRQVLYFTYNKGL